MKKALVFGHSSGLGLEVTKQLLSKDIKVVGIARSSCDIDDTNLVELKADLAEQNDINQAIEEVESTHSQFDHLIFCSGTLTAHEVEDLDYEQMQYLYRVNLFAPMKIESALLPLVEKNEADIVNVTSSAVKAFYPKFAEYSTSKAALQKFTNDLQQRLVETNSRVIDFCPSGFASNIYKSMSGEKVERDESIQMPTDKLAELMVYLLQLPKKIEISHIFVNRK